jgi:DNA polymerase-3 subunit gamma/tau
MTYLSLYRKWRPQTFEEVVGQRHVTQTLANAVKLDRVAHAYIFCGPRGTGKTSVAKILAKAVNCAEGPTSTPCNKCDACAEIAAGTSADVLEIDAASNRGIDDVRELRERVRYAPARGKKRVYIVDEVHMLTPEAFNALLKTLEEPPSHVIFVLATTEPQKVPQTILSRCQRHDFRRLAVSDISDRLREVSQKEDIEVEEATIGLIARHARGSLRDALGSLEQLAAFSGNRISTAEAASLLGTTDFDSLHEVVEAIAGKDARAALLATERITERGQDPRQFTRDLVEYLRGLFLMLSVGDHARVVDLDKESLERMKSQVAFYKPFQVLRFIDILSNSYRDMRWESDARILLDAALVRVIRSDIDVSVEGLVSRIEELEQRITGGEGPGAQTLQAEAEKSKDQEVSQQQSAEAETKGQKHKSTKMDFQKVKRAWPVILERVKSKKISTYALLLECQPCRLENGKLVLEFRASASFHKGEVEKEANKNALQAAIKEVLGETPELCCVEGEDKKERAQEVVSETENLTKQHAIDLLRDNLGAQIVEEQEQV